jgi:hypothetical protein
VVVGQGGLWEKMVDGGWRMELRGRQGNVNVFKKGLGGDAENTVGKFDEVIPGPAGMFAAERVGEEERFGELTGADEEAGAINVPRTFCIHHFFYPKTAFAVSLFGCVFLLSVVGEVV